MEFRSSSTVLLLAFAMLAARAQVPPGLQTSQSPETPDASAAPTKTDNNYKVEDEQVKAYFAQQKYLAALPLLEDLHAHDAESPYYDERLASALLARAATKDDPDPAATRSRARQLLLDARALGDNSNLLQIMLEKLGESDTASNAAAPTPLGYEYLQAAEKSFSSGDMPGAIANYQKALEVNPKFYEAALFAGDAEYKSGHLAASGEWYAKAIAIDPNRETAYRYWGDALEKAGEHSRAEQQFIQGILAQPYDRAPRLGLKQWADANRMRFFPPPIELPAPATPGKNGGMSITVQDSGKKSDPERAAALAYSMNSALWQGQKFKKTFPDEKTYRHSLAEELDSIHAMLSILKEQKVEPNMLSPSELFLMDLDKKNLLAAWVLIDHPDQGVAQDYLAFRIQHRDLLTKYITEYDLHPM